MGQTKEQQRKLQRVAWVGIYSIQNGFKLLFTLNVVSVFQLSPQFWVRTGSSTCTSTKMANIVTYTILLDVSMHETVHKMELL